MKNNSLLTFVTGAVIGAAAGILFAPEKGETVRRKIRETARDKYDGGRQIYREIGRLKDLLAEEGKEMKDEVKARILDQLDKLEAALSAREEAEEAEVEEQTAEE